MIRWSQSWAATRSACYPLCRVLVRPDFRFVRLEFSHAPLSPLGTYRKHFKIDVSFNYECDALWLEPRLLDEPLRSQNDVIKRAALTYFRELIQDYVLDVVQQVSLLIQQTLGMQEATIDNMARLLGLNKRTLQRQLKLQGVTFKELVTDLRMKSACWHLQSSAMDITLLSEILGYSDVSSFSHAFRKAMGIAPLAWRKAETGPQVTR